VKRGSPVAVPVPLPSSSRLVGVAASVGLAVSETRKGCLPGCERWKSADDSLKGDGEGSAVCVTVMKTVFGGGGGGGGVEGPSTVDVAVDLGLCSGVLGEGEVVFWRRSEDVRGSGA
jgi:hypothetical protein